MTQYNIYEAKTNFSKIIQDIYDKNEDTFIISKKGKPIAKIIPYEIDKACKRFGSAKGMFEIPDDFDEMDILSDFEGEI